MFVRENLEKKLKSGKKLRIKLGFDPTGDKIHIGRAIVLRKLREFQKLGHQIVFIIGDFTAMIGDPSDKLEKRPMLNEKSIEKNLKNYKEQIGKVIDIKKAEFHFNSKWLKKLDFGKTIELAEIFSVGQMLERRNFKNRYERGEEISLREFLYPLMQGYDSLMVNADIEIGGFDQLFNLKAGRVIQKHFNKPEQDILTTQMLEGTDGRKMSTSWGNVINLIDEPKDMFGKTMSLKDDLIVKYFLLCTDLEKEKINQIDQRLREGINPRDIKMDLAYEITKIYHGEKKAGEARDGFVKTFSEGEIPNDIKNINVSKGEVLQEIVKREGFVESNSEWRRLVEAGAIHDMISKKNISDPNKKIENDLTLKIGKKRFLKIVVK